MAAAEPTPWHSELPVLGFGLGYRDVWRGELFRNQRRVDFLEVTADHFLNVPREREDELDLLARHFPIIPHALNLSLGSAAGVNMRYVEQLAALIERVDAPWWSEHISFTIAGGAGAARDIGHLSPVPFLPQMLDVFARNIERVRTVIDRPLILENITYMVSLGAGAPGVMDEAAFVSALVERVDCGLLLDVTNLHVNSTNHGYDPIAYLDALPMHRVVQLHFVGAREEGALLIDDHATRTGASIYALMEEVYRRAPVRGAILERDADIPALSSLLAEVDAAREAAGRAGYGGIGWT